VAGGGGWLENAAWRADIDAQGAVRLVHRASGTILEDALRVVSEADRGDSYSFDPLPGGERVERPVRARVSLAPASAAYAAVRIAAEYSVPESLAPGRRARSQRRVALPVEIELGLFAGSDRLDVRVACDQTARDHRLRLHLRAPFAAERFLVESAFEEASRPIAPPPELFGAGRPAEYPDGATPQRRYARLESERLACVVANRGSSEVEAVPEGGATSLALTLVRAIGWLSRDDLARRPAHAGPPLETPGAQCLGRQCAEFSLWLGAREDARGAHAALAFADPPHVFTAGCERGGRLADGARLLAWDDPHVQLAALEPRAGGVTWIRLLNASDAARSVQVHWNGGGVLTEVDLRGRAASRAELEASAAPLVAFRPWQLVALEARRS
jgi:alpha-mannosidase/mannosylglycerate hydrolase